MSLPMPSGLPSKPLHDDTRYFSPELIVGLCNVAAQLPGPPNFERLALANVRALLTAEGPPNIDAVLRQLVDAHAHAFCGGFVENGLEKWLVKAGLQNFVSDLGVTIEESN